MKAGFLMLPALLAATGLTMAITSDSGNAYVERVIDGDTVVMGDGSKVRLVGIDAPEADEPCGQRATEALRRLVEHRVVTVSNPGSVQDRDRYGRLLRYLDTDADPAASLLTSGLAVARYDSSDGYDAHPRQGRYHGLESVAVAACPTLDSNSRWYNDPSGYHQHVEDQQRAREVRERREEAERRAAIKERRRARREAERLAYERALEKIRRENESSHTDSEQPDESYTGPRCYAPGGKTWKPC